MKEWTIEAARAAAGMERQVAVTNAAAKAFGITDARAQEAVETFKAVGYTTVEAEGAIRKLIVSQLGLEKTEGLAKMAKDAAAFSTTGVKAADAAEMLLRAMETGQSRGLRELNIYVDLNEVTKRAAVDRRTARQNTRRKPDQAGSVERNSGGGGKTVGRGGVPSGQPHSSGAGVGPRD